MLKNFRIEKKLTIAFVLVALIASIAAVFGCGALVYTSNQYAYALKNYGFSQGDIGKAMVTFSETRSATRAIIGYTDKDVINKAIESYEKSKAEFEQHMGIIEGTLTSEAEHTAYGEVKTELESYWVANESLIELGNTLDEQKSLEAQGLAADTLDPKFDKVYEKLNTLMELNITTGGRLEKNLSTLRIVLTLVIVGVIVGSIIISLILGKQIARGIAVPMGKLAARLKTFAQGNLIDEFPAVTTKDEVGEMIGEATAMSSNLNTVISDLSHGLGELAEGNFVVKLEAEYKGEFEKIQHALGQFIDKMRDTLGSINEASDQVAMGSTQLAENAQGLAEGATDQASSIEELQATINDVAEMIAQNAGQVKGAYKKTETISNEAYTSNQEMDGMVASMERINETSVQIGNIITEIESIASQTNLLALNASIEAARAGEAGKGFAVVADQIGKLADESAKSAANTKQLIETALAEVKQGNEITEKTKTALVGVVQGIEEFAEVSKNLAESSEKQSEAVHQIEGGIEQISNVVQNNSASAEETSATSEELSAQATTLKGLITQFKLM